MILITWWKSYSLWAALLHLAYLKWIYTVFLLFLSSSTSQLLSVYIYNMLLTFSPVCPLRLCHCPKPIVNIHWILAIFPRNIIFNTEILSVNIPCIHPIFQPIKLHLTTTNIGIHMNLLTNQIASFTFLREHTGFWGRMSVVCSLSVFQPI